jgi:ABC-type transporter Mla subunit MlaD
VRERHEEVTALRRQVQELMAAAAATKERIAADAAQSRTRLTELLEQARANLKTVSEQKAMVDQLNGRLASVQFVIQEAQNTVRMLNQERELVERLEESLRQLARTSETPGGR